MEDVDKIAFMHKWLETLEEIPKIFAEGALIIAFYYCFRIATRRIFSISQGAIAMIA